MPTSDRLVRKLDLLRSRQRREVTEVTERGVLVGTVGNNYLFLFWVLLTFNLFSDPGTSGLAKLA